MSNNGIVNIHGKDYVTVAKRVEMAHELGLPAVETEVLQHSPVVVVKATVTTPKGSYTGISSANPSKSIEKSNPYEVAETSAVGRALGFAGFGITEGIASADEMHKATYEDYEDVVREVNPDECKHTDFWVNTVKKEGPNKGKEFKSCKSCKKFLGWHTEDEDEDVKEDYEEDDEEEEEIEFERIETLNRSVEESSI